MRVNNVLTIMFATLMLLATVSAYSDSVYVEDYDLEISYDSATVDDIFTLTLKITNDASIAKNLTLDFKEDDPFEFITDDEITTLINSSETKTFNFRIEVDKDADSKSYDLEFNLDDGSDDWNDEFKLRIISDTVEITLGEIISAPKKIIPNSQEVKFDVTIKNSGDYTSENLIATLNLPEGFSPSSSYSDKVHLGDLASGISKTLTFYFDTDKTLSEASYTATLDLDYTSEGNDETKTLEIELPVFSIPQFEITNVKILTEGIYPGSTTKVRLAIQNIGGENSKDVSLKVYERSDQPFSFTEKSSYVGSLDVGETGYAIFDFEVDKDATPMSYILNYQVRSISGDSVLVDDVTSNINVTTKTLDMKLYLFVGIVIITILLIVLSIYVIRRA